MVRDVDRRATVVAIEQIGRDPGASEGVVEKVPGRPVGPLRAICFAAFWTPSVSVACHSLLDYLHETWR